MDTGYAFEKFLRAIDGMVRSPRSIQERVGNAISGQIMYVVEDDDELLGKLQPVAGPLRGYRRSWEAHPGGIPGWANDLSTAEAVEVATWIMRAYDVLSTLDGAS